MSYQDPLGPIIANTQANIRDKAKKLKYNPNQLLMGINQNITNECHTKKKTKAKRIVAPKPKIKAMSNLLLVRQMSNP